MTLLKELNAGGYQETREVSGMVSGKPSYQPLPAETCYENLAAAFRLTLCTSVTTLVRHSHVNGSCRLRAADIGVMPVRYAGDCSLEKRPLFQKASA